MGTSLQALMWGVISSISLPLGAAIGVFSKPPQKVTSSLMAFGGGALLFALTIELFGHALHVAKEKNDNWIVLTIIFGALLGGLLFEILNRLLNAQGGFLRKHALVKNELEKSKLNSAERMLKSLSEVSFLQALPPEEIASLIPRIQPRHFEANETIFQQGDEGLELYFIVKGSVEITRHYEMAEINIATMGTGDTFGEMALISDQPRTATVKTLAPTEVFSLGKADFVDLLKRSATMQEASKKIVIERLQGIRNKDASFREAAIEWHAKALDRFSQFPVIITDKDLSNAAQEHKGGAALAIWLGMALDGIPESLIIGMLVTAAAATNVAMSVAFIVGVFLANLPEAMSSAITMKKQKKSIPNIMVMWIGLCVISSLSALLGAHLFPADPQGVMVYLISCIEGIAAGAMLTMIANTMLPEAFEQGGGTVAGLSTLVGFLCALCVKLSG
jgi:CRP-like cAMP-binding protein